MVEKDNLIYNPYRKRRDLAATILSFCFAIFCCINTLSILFNLSGGIIIGIFVFVFCLVNIIALVAADQEKRWIGFRIFYIVVCFLTFQFISFALEISVICAKDYITREEYINKKYIAYYGDYCKTTKTNGDSFNKPLNYNSENSSYMNTNILIEEKVKGEFLQKEEIEDKTAEIVDNKQELSIENGTENNSEESPEAE